MPLASPSRFPGIAPSKMAASCPSLLDCSKRIDFFHHGYIDKPQNLKYDEQEQDSYNDLETFTKENIHKINIEMAYVHKVAIYIVKG